MGRANLLTTSGGIFHVTHRCHNRAFLLKFARDRDAYRVILHKQLSRFNLWVLDYCLTSNHVHLLILSRRETEVIQGADGLSVLREWPVRYGTKNEPQKRS
jgi:putative transposase